MNNLWITVVARDCVRLNKNMDKKHKTLFQNIFICLIHGSLFVKSIANQTLILNAEKGICMHPFSLGQLHPRKFVDKQIS